MDYEYLGPSSLKISELSLGTMIFGESSGRSTPEDVALQIMDEYIDRGGNFIDTANVYANGKSEEIIGKAIEGRREDLVVATKFRFPVDSGTNKSGLSRKNIMQSVEDSLLRLDTDYIDLFYIHATQDRLPVQEFMSTLNNLIEAGLVRYIGVSNFRAWELMKCQQVAKYRGWEPFIAAQYQYSLVERNIESEFLSLFEHENISQVPWGPLGGGFLSGKYRPDQEPPEGTRIAEMKNDDVEESWDNRATQKNWSIIRIMDEIVTETGATYPQVALRWLMNRPTVTSPILGVRTMEQLQDNFGVLDFQLSRDQMKRLNEVSKIDKPYPYGFLERYNLVKSYDY